jgi:glycosyltransferase involved in cell wall biosynthesis
MNSPALPTIGVVLRFKNSASTLPDVLASLRRQTVQPHVILGVNNASADGSPAILRQAGARLVDWTGPYRHPKVLNFALSQCATDLVLMLSSHTVLESPDTLAQLAGAFSDPRTACASGKWDADPFFSDCVDWKELQSKGIKFGSLYSNSMGMVRRSLWEQAPFDESLLTMEDGAWALEQIHRGFVCRRLSFPFRYQRGGKRRDYVFALITFQLAARHGLRVTWLGVVGTLRVLFRTWTSRLVGGQPTGQTDTGPMLDRLRAWALWRFVTPDRE